MRTIRADVVATGDGRRLAVVDSRRFTHILHIGRSVDDLTLALRECTGNSNATAPAWHDTCGNDRAWLRGAL